VALTGVLFAFTLAGAMLVDRVGRKFLLALGSGGIVVTLVATGVVFHRTERQRTDCAAAIQRMVSADQTVSIVFNQTVADRLLTSANVRGRSLAGRPATLVIIYSFGTFRAATIAVRSDDPAVARLELSRENCLPANRVVAFFSHPFGSLPEARQAPLRIERALVTPVPDKGTGWLTLLCLCGFIGFYASGPGVCVWLALSELMPTRIRSNGMSFALLINQSVSTAIAAFFLPMVGQFGYAIMFFLFAGCTIVYFFAAVFLLPETKGLTIEQIERRFDKTSKEDLPCG
jgi:MFS transporter, SP family, solute carrier family 2 (myo-inositol transporter), member 13